VASAPTAPKLIHQGDGLALGEVGNVYVAVWRGPVTAPRFEAQRTGLAEVSARNPHGIGFLCVIEPTAKAPDEQLRRASAQMVRRHEQELRCIGCVVEGSGFANAVARSALSAMALLVGVRSVPVSVFGNVGIAASWMLPYLGLRDAASLAQAVETIRSDLPPWR